MQTLFNIKAYLCSREVMPVREGGRPAVKHGLPIPRAAFGKMFEIEEARLFRLTFLLCIARIHCSCWNVDSEDPSRCCVSRIDKITQSGYKLGYVGRRKGWAIVPETCAIVIGWAQSKRARKVSMQCGVCDTCYTVWLVGVPSSFYKAASFDVGMELLLKEGHRRPSSELPEAAR